MLASYTTWYIYQNFSSVQSLSRVWLFVTPWIAARQASLSITNSRSSLRLTSIESVMPSSHLILRRPLLLLPLIPPSIRVFSNESTLHMRWPKYWSFSFSIIPSKEIPGLIFEKWTKLQIVLNFISSAHRCPRLDWFSFKTESPTPLKSPQTWASWANQPPSSPVFPLNPFSSGLGFNLEHHVGPVSFSSVQLLSPVRLLATPWIAACQASLSITNSRSSLRLTSIELVMPSSHLILCRPLLLLPPIPPSIGVFPMSQLFAWGGQSIGVSALASVLPKNTQDWSPSEWTGWISLQSKGLSRVFSNTRVQRHQFFGAQFSSQSNSHIHTWPLEKP